MGALSVKYTCGGQSPRQLRSLAAPVNKNALTTETLMNKNALTTESLKHTETTLKNKLASNATAIVSIHISILPQSEPLTEYFGEILEI